MTNIPSVSTAGLQSFALRNTANASRTPQAAAPAQQAIPPAVKVDLAASQVAYGASLNTLRTANKMMMGYLLNIEV
jgi:hypothetical protein